MPDSATLDAGRPAAAAGTVTIGGTLTVHRLGFGAMRLAGGQWSWGPPDDEARAREVLRRAVALGVEFIDTADAYGPYVVEDLIASTLSPYPPGLVIATKGGQTRSGWDKWEPVGRPEYLRQCVAMSARRLGVERIDRQLGPMGSPRPKSHWHGCSSGHPPCCPFPERRRPSTLRRIAGLRPSGSPIPSLRRSVRWCPISPAWAAEPALGEERVGIRVLRH